MKTPETGKDIHVLRKTHEEIKKGLAACSADECHGEHKECPYQEQLFCIMHVCGDALAYIQQLESRLAQVERERDAAVADLKLVRCCGTCVNNDGGCTKECYIVSGILTGWQWRGVCPENSKEETK